MVQVQVLSVERGVMYVVRCRIIRVLVVGL